ncbi:hypothetical protein PVK06_010445 [Gossypium arboreum]|uniref:Uncharacterized protein n=1 Tax=Gossypium arboreum TaxID=29729 RepID=A0ABR0Q6V1_GOSAR|nr:hypothetical protein PVK06_010445 [Gossypium arboreum]
MLGSSTRLRYGDDYSVKERHLDAGHWEQCPGEEEDGMRALRNRSLSKEMLELSGLSQQITLSSTTSMVDWLEKTIRILKKDNLESLVMML